MKISSKQTDGFHTKPVVKPMKTGIGQALNTKLTKGPSEYVRLFVGSIEGLPFEKILHRPIGVTLLDDDEWVVSSPDDVATLLTRVENPDEKAVKLAREKWKLEQVVSDGLLKIDPETKVVSYPNGMERNTYLKTYRERAQVTIKSAKKDAAGLKGKGEGKSYTTVPTKVPTQNELVLQYLIALKGNDPNADYELDYADRQVELKGIAETMFPFTYTTCKGPYGDHEQVALGWAKGLSPMQLQSEVAKYLALGFALDFRKNSKIMDSFDGGSTTTDEEEAHTGGLPDEVS